MGVTTRAQSWLTAAASARPHVLVVGVPGHAHLRMAAEAVVAQRHAALATSAADADILLVAGRAGPQLTRAVDVLWAQLPGPRARVQVTSLDDVDDAFAVATDLLADTATQRADAHARTDTWTAPIGPADTRATDLTRAITTAGQDTHDGDTHDGDTHDGDTHDGDTHDGDTHDGDTHDGDPFGGHQRGNDLRTAQQPVHSPTHDPAGISPSAPPEPHDMHSMGEMQMPGGLMMADRAEDRDGLKLDVLHVPLGPFLPGWPAGLVIHARLQGDIIQAARAQVLDHLLDNPALADGADPDANATDASRAVVALDALAALLTAADWHHAAGAARAARDDLHADPNRADLPRRLRRLTRRVARSRTLRARGARLGIIDPAEAGPDLAGDSLNRWLRWLSIANSAVPTDSPGSSVPVPRHTSTTGQRLEYACRLIVGLDLGAARIVIASLDIRPGDQGAPVSASAVAAGV